jgi:hypothetical protein
MLIELLIGHEDCVTERILTPKLEGRRPATGLQLHKYNSLSVRRSLLLHTTTQPLNLGNLIIHTAAGQV